MLSAGYIGANFTASTSSASQYVHAPPRQAAVCPSAFVPHYGVTSFTETGPGFEGESVDVSCGIGFEGGGLWDCVAPDFTAPLNGVWSGPPCTAICHAGRECCGYAVTSPWGLPRESGPAGILNCDYHDQAYAVAVGAAGCGIQDPNAACVDNGRGSHTCVCNAGFSGDGMSCMEEHAEPGGTGGTGPIDSSSDEWVAGGYVMDLDGTDRTCGGIISSLPNATARAYIYVPVQQTVIIDSCRSSIDLHVVITGEGDSEAHTDQDHDNCDNRAGSGHNTQDARVGASTNQEYMNLTMAAGMHEVNLHARE